MSPRSIEEYAAAVRRRYQSSIKVDKRKILDDFGEAAEEFKHRCTG